VLFVAYSTRCSQRIRRETARAGCRAGGPGSAGGWRRAPAAILPTGYEGLPSTPRASAVTRERRPRIPGTSWPSRCSARISGMPSSAIHVLWLCRRPWGVSPSLTGSQQAREASSEGCCPPPGQCSSFALWVTVVPSRRSLTARPQHGQWPVPSADQTRRATAGRGSERLSRYRRWPRRDWAARTRGGVHHDQVA
jgi:hypothetical protein